MRETHVVRRRRHRFAFLYLLRRADFDIHQDARDVTAHRIEQTFEQFEGFALVFLLRVLLRIAAQMDALTQVVERGEVFAPVTVQALQHHVVFELPEGIGADQRDLHLILIVRQALDTLEQIVIRKIRFGGEPFGQRCLDTVFRQQCGVRACKIPLLFYTVFRHVLTEGVGKHAVAHGCDGFGNVARFEQ